VQRHPCLDELVTQIARPFDGRRGRCAWETTVAEQRRANAHARDGISEDEFVAMREGRDRTLAMPRLILPSV